MDVVKVKKFFVFFFPLLVFVIVLTAPGGEYVFRAGPPAEVAPGLLPSYVGVVGDVLYLYSSPYAPWRYDRAIKVDLHFPTELYVVSSCGFIPPFKISPPVGTKWVDITVPPSFEGSCFVNFTHPSGWRRFVELRVKLIDWYPAQMRAVVRLQGRGWQFVQVGADGVLYVWEKPVANLPVVGCAAVYNGSLLLYELARYVPAHPHVSPPPLLFSSAGEARYGYFVYLKGEGTLYVYAAECPPSSKVAVREVFNFTTLVFGPYVPTPRGYLHDSPRWRVASYNTTLRQVVVANGTGETYTLYSFWYSTPLDMWGGVLHFDFKFPGKLTTDVIFISPRPPVEPDQISHGVWMYNGTPRIWVAGPERPAELRLPLPRSTPLGWVGPFYVVVDGRGDWGGWPAVIYVVKEELKPWSR